MSIRIMTLAWDTDLSGNDLLLLLALADWANDDGHCWPSIPKLCAKTRASERTVQGIIKQLVAAGHLTRREKPGCGCKYIVHPRNSCAPAEAAPPQVSAKTPAEVAGNTSRTTNIPEASASGGEPPKPPEPESPVDLAKAVFDSGVPYLGRYGTPERQARSLLGKWRQEFGDGAVLEALAASQIQAASDPVPFITATLRKRHDRARTAQHSGNHAHGPAADKDGFAAGIERAVAASCRGDVDFGSPDPGDDLR